jgi:glucuronoarabinoxylan endo-1,4-beta-xylanase
LNDATAFANMDILGFHLYGTPVNQFAYSLFQQKRGTDKKAWMTEHYFDTDGISDIMAMSKELHDCMVTGNMNAYIYWWITWPNGLANSNGTIFKRAYVLGQFSKFIRPGYYRVDATATPASNVYVSAYAGNSKAVIVAVNTGSSAVSQKFSFQNGSVSSVVPYTTDNTKNLVTGSAIAVSANSFTAQLPPQSITTFVGSTVVTAIESEESDENASVQIFPNPFTSSFEIETNEPCAYSIHDASGKLVKEGKAFGKETMGNDLQSGIYFVKLTTSQGTKITKVVKQ